MMPKDRLEQILDDAVLAPSGHNSQPWQFTLEGGGIAVSMLPERDLPLLNVERRGTLIATGALLENMVIAGQTYGLQADIHLFPDAHTTARVQFATGSTQHHPLFRAIKRRHTHRGAYHSTVPKDAIVKIQSAAREASCRITITYDKPAVTLIAHAESMMVEATLRTRWLHRLFFNTIIWKDSHNRTGRPGIYIKATELPGPVRFLFRAMQYWPIMNVLNKIGFAQQAARSNALIYAQTGACIAIMVRPTDPEAFIAVGRCMQRIWLTVTEAGLVAQPLASLLYLAEYVMSTGNTNIDPTLKERILKARKTIESAVGALEGERVAMLLRIGVPLYPASAHSHRYAPRMVGPNV